jgi:hypothetical protein
MTDSAGKGGRQRLHPPFAQPDPGRRATPVAAVATMDASVAELPSIQQFVDDLPSIDEFLLEADAVERSRPLAGLEIDEEGWAAADWQSYDWTGVASLGARVPEAIEANAAWSSTDWDTASSRQGGLRPFEVAAALEEMASRIRSGELSLERFYGTLPEAAMAAAFSAQLRTKR